MIPFPPTWTLNSVDLRNDQHGFFIVVWVPFRIFSTQFMGRRKGDFIALRGGFYFKWRM